jgi:hypothetical protein
MSEIIVNEICKISVSIYFVYEGEVTPPLTNVVGEVVVESSASWSL